MEYQEINELNSEILPGSVNAKFLEKGINIPDGHPVEVIKESEVWQINHDEKTHMIDNLGNRLVIYNLGSVVKSVTLFNYDDKNFIATVNNNISKLPGTPNPKWVSESLTLKVELRNKQVFDFKNMEYDWQHIALTLDFGTLPERCYCKLYRHNRDDDKTHYEEKTMSNVSLRSHEKLSISDDDRSGEVFTVQMSEFRLWNKIRSVDEIHNDLNWRMYWETGLLHIPMNETEPNSIMTLVDSDLSFEYIEKLTELPIPIEERERVIMFYGDDQKLSIRDNLIDQNFTLKLKAIGEEANEYYDINLLYASLDIVETLGLSINDYAESGGSTLKLESEQNLLKMFLLLSNIRLRQVVIVLRRMF